MSLLCINSRWQAGDHDNGSIIVQRYPTLLEQREGWKDSSSGVQSFSSPSAYGSLDAEVAKVVREPGITWNGWAIDNQSVIAFALDGAIAPHAASLITLIPTFEPRSHVEFRQSFMLHVSLPASISIGPGGEVLLNSEAGGESLHLRKLSSSLADASSSEPNELQRHLGNLYSLSPDFVALAVPGTPILKLYLLPLFPSKGETRISIPHSLIFPHFPSGSRLLVFSPDTHTANFLDESIPLEGTVQSHGGYLIITPAMELGSGWLVASLSNISIVDKILQPPSVENQATVPSSQLANPSNSGSDAQSNALFAPAVQLALLVNMLLALFFASLGGKPSSFHPNPDLPVNGQIDGAQSGPMEAQDPPLSDLNEKQQTLAFDLRNTPQTFSFLFHKAGSSISELSFALGQQEFEPHVQALNGSDGSYLVSLEREHKETGLEVSIRE
ncbi:hypothetical protein SISSUDRAFT_550031 [Sistotremastrum suecicum HHB10207 ss-3]|uniref:Uncharacterized protein n=1 Tax=Sistotremastrum suecicum HHB10207 ss-3 TaxID=1314776 RepID=A0A166EZC1_9AGAM|nr:hypothetical protein SISSUDRAFT_550031 [Sistotremastrum suecicum HHB10207 ss-3]